MIVRVLVVDDHPGTATTMARAISQLGSRIDVLTAESGEQALELVKNKMVDLLITDLLMPGITGLELIEKLQAHPGGRPVYTALITAYDVPGVKEAARRLRVNQVINKPIRPERVCQIVAKAVEELGHAPIFETPANKPKLKILVADDVPDNVTLLSRYLESEGYTCLSASDGVDALTKIHTEMPDLVLLDVSMPKKDGFEALQEMRADAAIGHIPVIILTAARIEPMDIRYALSIGADDYVTKPFDRRELLARIRTRLRVKEAEDIIRRRNKELNLLLEIGRELSACLDVDDVIEVVLHRTVETLGAYCGQVVLLTPNGPLHKSYYFSPSTTVDPEAYVSLLTNLIGQVNETRQGFIIDDTFKDSRWKTIAGDASRAVVGVPMFGRHDILGLLVLTHKQVGYFTTDHKLLLQAIASQAAIAVENAQSNSGSMLEYQRMMAFLQNAEDAILLFDPRSRLSLLNPAAGRLFGGDHVKIDQPLTKGHGYDTLIALLEEVASTGHSVSGEIEWVDNRVFAVFIIPVEGGGCLVLLHDISNSKLSDQPKNDLIATTAHDLKHPLTLITLTSQMLSKVGPLNEKQMEIVDRIGRTVKNMDGLVRNMLELARAEKENNELQFEKVDVNALVSEVANEFQLQAEARQQSFQLERSQKLPVIQGNPFQLRHALRNLADNAIKYTPAGGAICLSVETGEKEVIVRIKDSGYGIPSDDLPFIFNRFYRGHSKEIDHIMGSGLGLAIVKSIVEQHHGCVTVESEYGKGSCFAFTLPLLKQPEPSS